jgi:hypothetical protein
MHVLDERSPLHGYDMARKYVTTFVIASFRPRVFANASRTLRRCRLARKKARMREVPHTSSQRSGLRICALKSYRAALGDIVDAGEWPRAALLRSDSEAGPLEEPLAKLGSCR